MTLTTDQVQVPEAPGSAPTGAPASPRRFGTVAGWVAAAGAVAAAGLLAVTVLTPDDSPSRIDTGRTVAEYGSISAIEHSDELAVRAAAARRAELINPDLNAAKAQDRIVASSPSATVAEWGSISAIEHRDELAVRAAAQRAAERINPDLNAANAQERIVVP